MDRPLLEWSRRTGRPDARIRRALVAAEGMTREIYRAADPGIAVVGDSPQFSALNAANAPPGLVGSALTIANCIGFAITIPSIELLNATVGWLSVQYAFLLLVPGPVLGLLAMRPLVRKA